jgi:hypothetical protein
VMMRNGCLFVRYEPGNGTSYRVIVSPPARTNRVPGITSDSCMVTLLWGIGPAVSAFFRSGEAHGYLAVDYVREKLNLNEADGAVVTELVAALLERDADQQGPVEAAPSTPVLYLMKPEDV